METNREIRKEIISLESEKRMDKLALVGYQNTIAEQLRGNMGNDINNVLSGKVKVKMPFWSRIKSKFRKMLWNLSLEQ